MVQVLVLAPAGTCVGPPPSTVVGGGRFAVLPPLSFPNPSASAGHGISIAVTINATNIRICTPIFASASLARVNGQKNGFEIHEVNFLYTFGYDHKESWKKKFLNLIYYGLSLATDKFAETLVLVSQVHRSASSTL